MATILAPEDIQRPGVARDQGVTARPSAALPSQIQDSTGAALANFGESFGQIANTSRELFKLRQDAEDKAFVDHYQLELNKTFPTIESEMLNSPASGKHTYVNDLDKRLQDKQTELMDKLIEDGVFNPSKKGRQDATHAAMQLRETSARRSSIAAHNQRVTSLASTIDANVLETARTAGAAGDLEGGWDRVESSVKTLQGVLTPEKYEAYRHTARAQVVENVIRGHISRGEFDEARALIDQNRGFAANSQEGIIAAAASKNGIDPAYLVATQRVESGGNPQAQSATSSAKGLFGFISDVGVEYGLPADARNASVADQADAAARLTASNKTILSGELKRDPSSGELYLAHVLGARGALKVLNANPNAPIQSVVSPEAFSANQSLMKGKTAADMVDWANGKIMSVGGGGALQYIPEEKRIQLLNSIESKQNQSAVLAQKQHENYVKEVNESLMKEAYSRADKGTLDSSFVEQAKSWVSATNYKTLLNLASTDEGNVDDNFAIQELTPLVHTDSTEEFQKKANMYFEAKKLKASTYRAMVNGNQAAFKDDRPQSPYKSGRDLISTTLDPGLMSGPAGQVLRVGRANALIEYDNWMSNPKNSSAPREDVIAAASDIIRRYEPISYGEMKLATGVSRYFGKVSKKDLTFDNQDAIDKFINNAEDQLASDDSNGRLTKAQLEYEVRALKTWREILSGELTAKRRAAEQKKK